MKAVVTGGVGYIGSHLVQRLLKDGWEVIVWDIAKPDYIPHKVQLWDFCITKNPGIELFFPICDFKCDVVFHLAAVSRIQPSFEDPLKTFNTNVMGTLNVLECAKIWGAKVVYSSTCCCKYNEYSSPYALSKYQGEMLCKMYENTVIARLFNVYGGNEIASGAYSTVVGIFKKLTEEDKLLTITGDGANKRDFIHVDDVIDALILLYELGTNWNPYEIGRGKNHSVEEVAEMFQPGKVRIMLPSRVGEEKETLADHMFPICKLQNWHPKINLKDYIEEVVNGITEKSNC